MMDSVEMLYPGLREMGQYGTIVIDPPWNAGRSTSHYSGWDYRQLSTMELTQLPIKELLLPDARVFIWGINGLPLEPYYLLPCWGLEYEFTGVWHKNNGPKGGLNKPTYNMEPYIVGHVGKPKLLKNFKVCQNWPRRGHSKKPQEFYDMLKECTPGPHLDIFARTQRPGWDCYGDQMEAVS